MLDKVDEAEPHFEWRPAEVHTLASLINWWFHDLQLSFLSTFCERYAEGH